MRSGLARRRSLVPLAALLAVLPLAGCQEQGAGAAAPRVAPVAFVPPPAGPSRAPAPVERAGLRTLAESRDGTLALHTETGDITFWTGVNLGSTTPGHSPGELAISAEQYRSWFAQMGAMGVRVLRVYTIHGPQMYEELRTYNLAHPGAPLYLSQGVYLPDESYTQTRDLHAVGPTRAFTQELRDASAAVHGDLVRPDTPGRASGRWTADVSPWLASWIVGVELEPTATATSDRRNAAAPEHRGRYFSSRADDTATTPTERWLAARMDELATAEAARGTSAPVAFVNWPTTDPVRHPTEPQAAEDLVGVDASHVVASAAWPGGTFASYHAYPYYPDFQRHQPGYQGVQAQGRSDPYAGYLADLKEHHAGMPVLVSEFGVPSSLGSAHLGTLGRHQGDHSEQEALAMDAALLRVISDVGLAGGLLFSWTDEWFKFTWNTRPRHAVADEGRRALWHDPLTNEQWFGLLAQDPVGTGWRTLSEASDDVQRVEVRTDESFVELRVRLDRPLEAPLRLGFDVVPGGLPLPGGGGEAVHDVGVVLDPAAGSGTASVRGAVDPVQLDGLTADDLPRPGADGWSLQRMTTNHGLVVPGRGSLPAEFLPVGELRRGTWDPAAAGYDSRATWEVDGQDVRLRLPWSMLLLGDPSSRTAVVPEQGRPVGLPVDQITVVADTGRGVVPAGAVRWETWQTATARERVKVGVQPYVDAMAELGR